MGLNLFGKKKPVNGKKKNSDKMSWSQFQQILSDAIDEDIIKYANESGKVYLGGKCTFSADVNENKFSRSTTLIAAAELYFKDQFSDQAEIRTVTRKCDYNEFLNDTVTFNELQRIINYPYELKIEKPTLKKE